MITDNQLTEVFDKACRQGIDALSDEERKLYLIQDFILEWEMGFLSGYLYNRIPDFSLINETIECMKFHGLTELANILSEANGLFHNYEKPQSNTTWGNELEKYDPNGQLDDFDKQIRSIEDYGIK